VDINSAVGRKLGVTDQQLAQLANFEQSELFSPVEKAILRYAQGMSRTPVDVSDALFAELQGYFNSAQLVELTAALALENYRARFNRALEIPSEGFCELPANHPVRKRAVDMPLPKTASV
jgi:alkylhydroperoxidase family enzyme